MVKLIIFDWDDVITLGSTEGYLVCTQETLEAMGVRISRAKMLEALLPIWSNPHRDQLGLFVGDKPAVLDEACRIYEEKFFGDVFVDALKIVPGVPALLKRLQENYKLAVATGAHPVLLRERIMPKFGIPEVFAEIVSAYDIGDSARQKPNPYMLEKIMADSGVEPAETVFVGDAKTDVQMAQNARVEPIVVLTGHLTRAQARELGVRHIIHDVTGLEAVLTEL